MNCYSRLSYLNFLSTIYYLTCRRRCFLKVNTCKCSGYMIEPCITRLGFASQLYSCGYTPCISTKDHGMKLFIFTAILRFGAAQTQTDSANQVWRPTSEPCSAQRQRLREERCRKVRLRSGENDRNVGFGWKEPILTYCILNLN